MYQDEIVYMESQGHKVNFHLSLGMSVRILTAHTTIDAMQLQLNQNRFVRPHKSFLVNCSYIDKIECGNILLQSGDRITIRKAARKMSMHCSQQFYKDNIAQKKHICLPRKKSDVF